ncbi:MAG: Alcohol dehydrogenase GroES-like domain, partial [Chloroflexota bacterium]|nr:Alcohol dehydrogenase GroES-like domain [Chloroflexota bacterium]
MRALVVDPTLTDAGSGRGGRGRRRRQASSSLPVEIRDVRTPVPPGPGWVLVRPALAGICGTDLALVHRDAIPNVLTAYGAAGTIIPGHEVV